ncbi:hypothetical protein pipiens_010542, partial [Culex pipiens pipiens]
TKSSTEVNKKVTFWFATGGAGFCISRALALKMLPIASSGKFVAIGDKIRFPDDVTMGFIVEHILNVPLTVVDAFHSHLEPMEFIRPETFHDQVSFSYARMRNEWNVVKVDGFDLKTDPKRIYSLHCYLRVEVLPVFRGGIDTLTMEMVRQSEVREAVFGQF